MVSSRETTTLAQGAGDNQVSMPDDVRLRNQLGTSGPEADIIGDGMVGPDDYLILQNHWHKTGDPG